MNSGTAPVYQAVLSGFPYNAQPASTIDRLSAGLPAERGDRASQESFLRWSAKPAESAALPAWCPKLLGGAVSWDDLMILANVSQPRSPALDQSVRLWGAGLRHARSLNEIYFPVV